jgi:hypothetical protein
VLYFATQIGLAIAVGAETGRQQRLFTLTEGRNETIRPVPARGVN